MIRELQPDDYAAVAGFWRDLLGFASATDESVGRTLEKMSADRRYGTFVAEENGRVVGFITFVEVLSIDDPDGYLKINRIAVMPEYRRRGIAQQLIERVEHEARERGACSVGVATSFKRTGSQALFQKLGYEKAAFWFHKNF